ncbi:MAG: SapC family protein, partial [Sphingopyxis sp.]|nr:SapC family protein [Sphingopyxis sp.]
VPAYVRRYPFLLARLQPDSEDLSLCFDPSSNALGKFDEGDAMFVDGQPSEQVQQVLEFCKNFEEAGQRTGFFMEELKKADLLMDGEVAIQQEGNDKPYVYRGFQMVDENKLRELRGDVLRKLMQNGILALIFAHLFSLQLMREVFAEQIKTGKVPLNVDLPAA